MLKHFRLVESLVTMFILSSVLAAGADKTDPLPPYTIHVQVVQLADDDGGRATKVLPEAVKGSVDIANQVYAPVGLRLVFDPQTDWAVVKSTAANNLNVEPRNPRVAVKAGNEIATRYPGKLVVLFRYGPGKKPIGSGFSYFNENFVVLGGVYTGSGHRFSHEFGHYLGLAHTHRPGFDSVQEAAAFFKKSGRNPSVFDGDGLSDTPPDPLIRPFRKKSNVTIVELDGVKFELPRRNLMSYYNGGDSLTPQQIAIARWFLERRVKNNMRFPVNADAASPIQTEILKWSGAQECGVSKEKISIPGYDPRHWSNDSWLLLRFGEKGSIRLTVPVAEAGLHRLDVYTAMAQDFGKVRFSLNGEPLGGPVDAYAPRTVPSGRISLDTVNLAAGDHMLQIDVAGKNTAVHRLWLRAGLHRACQAI